MLDGDNKYMCGTCNHKVDAVMRDCLNELPNTLLVHLKRFEFDYEKMKHIKVNDVCEFPMILNLEPFTRYPVLLCRVINSIRAGIAKREAEMNNEAVSESVPEYPPSYYDYELVGVVVHIGSADAGHYYSYIKERVPMQVFE